MNTRNRTANAKRHRARWAAIGAAVAVSMGAGGIGFVQATTSPSGASTFVAKQPCRLLDTRPGGNHIGPHTTIGANSQITVTARGNVGQCSGADALPDNASALQLNVTALGATAPTYLSVYPGSGGPPNTSSLNPTPGQPPTPNAVTTTLDGDGRFSIYNLQGSIDVIVDVVGYYTGDFSISGDEIADGTVTGADVKNNSLTRADILDEPGIAVGSANYPSQYPELQENDQVIGTVRLNVPADGFVTVVADVMSASFQVAIGECQIVKNGSSQVSGDRIFRLHDGGSSSVFTSTSAHRTFPVSPADNSGSPAGVTFNVVCNELHQGKTWIRSVDLTAQYFPTDRTPTG